MITTPYTGLFRGGTRAYVALVLSKGVYSICPGCKDLTEDSNVRYSHLRESHPCLTERGGRKTWSRDRLQENEPDVCDAPGPPASLRSQEACRQQAGPRSRSVVGAPPCGDSASAEPTRTPHVGLHGPGKTTEQTQANRAV